MKRKKSLLLLCVYVLVLVCSNTVLADPKPYYSAWFGTPWGTLNAYEGDIFETAYSCDGDGVDCTLWASCQNGWHEDKIQTNFKTPGSTTVLNDWYTEYYDIEQNVWRAYNGGTTGNAVDSQMTGVNTTKGYRYYSMTEDSDIYNWERSTYCGFANPVSALRWQQSLGGGMYQLNAVEFWSIWVIGECGAC